MDDPALSPLVDVPLDVAQRRAVELPAGGALLVLGEAGHGKTTVALHRLAHLARGAAIDGRRFRAVVVVPSEGLRRLVERALVRLGVDAPALTFDRFARRQARRAFAGLPRRESRDATAATIRLKRDPALAIAIEAVAAAGPRAIDDAIDEAPTPRADLQHLFGDRALLEETLAAGGRFPRHAIEQTLEHTRVQFGLTSEEAWAHVDDRARLVPVDRRSLDDATPDADAQTIDAEDYAVLFAIDRARAARESRRAIAPRRYDAVVIDEAQELAPIELALLGASLARGASLVVAGDADQQIDDGASFGGWDATMAALGHASHARVVLDVGYRCAPAVAALARRARDGAGPSFAVARLADEASLARHVARRAEAWLAAAPRARVAVVCRAPRFARRFVTALREATPARLVLDGAFSFAPGVDVTTVDQVRGLEVEHVIVPDASAEVYPDDPAARRALYVAVTRARIEVELACVGAATRLVDGD